MWTLPKEQWKPLRSFKQRYDTAGFKFYKCHWLPNGEWAAEGSEETLWETLRQSGRGNIVAGAVMVLLLAAGMERREQTQNTESGANKKRE